MNTRTYAREVFDHTKIREHLAPVLYARFERSLARQEPLDSEVADVLARAIATWARQEGATHFAHWFQPLTGLTAGKQESFLIRTREGGFLEDFSGEHLIRSEPDASSFPHGGMRSTFEARGYTAWDPASPVFIARHSGACVLMVPSLFVGFHGEVLDKKTPLNRSTRLIHEEARSLLSCLGQKVDWVRAMAGPEQEFFLFREEDVAARPDLRTVQRLLFAARPARGQQMGDHYFGDLPAQVLRFYEAVEEESLRLGIPVKTRHAEVAPNQFEIAPIYEEAGMAADHNQMLMDVISRQARGQGMVAIFHEKPFSFFNGSGKHVNWSLQDSRGNNLMAAGKKPAERLRFLAFLTAFLQGMYHHNDLIAASMASAGNELRLGGHEAPPAVISVHMGEEFQNLLQDPWGFVTRPCGRRDSLILEGGLVPPIPRDLSDRNRTSPVAYTGNKFEFRMVGSSASIAFPLTAINLAVSDGMARVRTALEGIRGQEQQVEVLGRLLREAWPVVFDGDNYGDAWKAECVRRGLSVSGNVPERLALLGTDKNKDLFTRWGILSERELEARTAVKEEVYTRTVEMELRVARYLLRAFVIPAALRNQNLLISALDRYPQALLGKFPRMLDQQMGFIGKFTQKLEGAMEILSALDARNEDLKACRDFHQGARLAAREIRPLMGEAEDLVAKLEERIDRSFWGLPRATDMLLRY